MGSPPASTQIAAYFGLFFIFATVWTLLRWQFSGWLPSVYHFDYLSRVVLLAAVFGIPVLRRMVLESAKEPLWSRRTVIAAVLATMIGSAVFLHLYPPLYLGLESLFGDTVLFAWPVYSSTTLKLFDVTIGLVLVAVSEEIVFRKFALQALENLIESPVAIILASSLLFASIHWETGLANTIMTFFFGVIVMTAYVWTRRLWPCIVAHYFCNLVSFVQIPVAA